MPFPIRSRAVLHAAGAVLLGATLAAGLGGLLRAGFEDTLPPDPLDPAVEYFEETTRDPIARLQERMNAGEVELVYQERGGYLASLLEALDISVSSQLAVFSRTSLQAPLINPSNPRTIFFNDETAIGWMHGGFIEVASQDPERGVIFYALDQEREPDPSKQPRFIRMSNCLGCHEADLGVPGMLARTQVVSTDGDPLLIYGGDFDDHRTAFDGRWGGWYVTGIPEAANRSFPHLGNTMLAEENAENPVGIITPRTISVESLEAKFDTSRYLSPYSDVAALMVFDHQTHMINLLIRAGWEARVELAADVSAEAGSRAAQVIEDAARQVADYMLFVGEAALPAPVAGADPSGFRTEFMSRGPFDAKGRSLRDLDLVTRLMRYPLSYMLYSPAFEALPEPLRAAIYARLWDVLTSKVTGAEYAHLDAAARSAIIEIVQATKTDLPDPWSANLQ